VEVLADLEATRSQHIIADARLVWPFHASLAML
jgi:hypothetical protein